MQPIEDYAVLGDLQTAALVGRDGSVDWLCLPRFDSPACFAALLDTPDAGRWRIAPVDAERCTRRTYRGHSLVLESEWETPDGVVRVVDLMPPRGEAPDVVRIVEGVSGRRDGPQRAAAAVRLREHHALGEARRRTARRGRRPDCAWLRTDVPLDGPRRRHLGRRRRRGRRPSAVRAHVPGVPQARAGTGGRLPRPGADRDLLARLDRPLRLRGRLGRRRPQLARRPQGAHVRADRRHGRRRHDVAAGGDRRRAELGLPLLLAARLDAHPAGAARRRLRRRGRRVAGLAAARGRRRPAGPQDHVRHPRRAATAGVRAPLARAATRARGRSGSATAPPTSSSSTSGARCSTACNLAREAGLAPVRRRVGAAARAHGPPRGPLAGPGPRAVGGPRTRAPVRALAGHGLGRRRPHGRAPSSSTASRGRWTGGGRRATRSTGRCASRATTPSGRRSRSTSAAPASTRRCC